MYTDGPKLTMVKLMSFQLYHGAKVTQIAETVLQILRSGLCQASYVW